MAVVHEELDIIERENPAKLHTVGTNETVDIHHGLAHVRSVLRGRYLQGKYSTPRQDRGVEHNTVHPEIGGYIRHGFNDGAVRAPGFARDLRKIATLVE